MLPYLRFRFAGIISLVMSFWPSGLTRLGDVHDHHRSGEGFPRGSRMQGMVWAQGSGSGNAAGTGLCPCPRGCKVRAEISNEARVVIGGGVA